MFPSFYFAAELNNSKYNLIETCSQKFNCHSLLPLNDNDLPNAWRLRNPNHFMETILLILGNEKGSLKISINNKCIGGNARSVTRFRYEK